MTAYEMRISYWSSDGCSSDLTTGRNGVYQREINEALELLRGRRPGTIYIIPLRLEDAPLPSELGRLQYVDHFVASPLLVLATWRHRRRLAATGSDRSWLSFSRRSNPSAQTL